MQFRNWRSAARWIAAMMLGAVLISTACSQSSNPLDSEFPAPDYSHAAGAGYIGPASSAPRGLARPPAEGGAPAAPAPAEQPAASPAPIPGS
jgi:hypothetical protein